MHTIHVNTSKPYDVLIGEGLLDKAGELTAKAIGPRKCLIVTDDTVDELYADRVQISFTYAGFTVSRFSFPAGEASKNLETLSDILNAMGEIELSRSDLAVALGGGVVGDMAGFAAAVYTRGIRFVQIPTTLLSAVDSSVGGKTAIDMPFGKNMVGAFHQPSLVITDTDVIRELPPLQLSNGTAEVIKCGVLNDPDLFTLMKSAQWQDRMEEVISRCVSYKRDIVTLDEFDNGQRALLNLGHTFGHAIEVLSGLKILHGQAVAIGMVMAASAAGLSDDLILQLSNCLRTNGLPTHCPYGAEALASAALSDKKRAGDRLTLVLPQSIGNCILKNIAVSELTQCFRKGLRAQEALGL